MLSKTRNSEKPGGPLEGAGELWLSKGCALLKGQGWWQREAKGTDLGRRGRLQGESGAGAVGVTGWTCFSLSSILELILKYEITCGKQDGGTDKLSNQHLGAG